MFFIRQNATHKVVLGPAVAVGDGFTPVTTLALSSADEAEAILHDNGTVVSISGYTWAAITTADGYYHLTLQSGISGTVGHMTVVVNDDSLCLPLRADFTVLEEAVYDQMFAGSAPGAATVAALATAQADLDTITGSDGVTLATTQGNYAPATAAALATHDGKLDTVDGNVDAILLDTGTDGVVVAAGSKTGYSLTATTGLGNQTANITGNLSGSVGSVTGAINTAAGVITTLDALDTAQDSQHSTTQTAIQTVDNEIATIDGNVDLILEDTGTTLPATLNAIAGYLDTEIAAILADTNELQGDWADGGRLDLLLDALPTAAEVNAEVDTAISDAALATAAELAKVPKSDGTATWNATALASIEAECEDALQLTVPDSVPADGSRPNMQQAVYMLVQILTEFAISGTTITVKKPDGSTTLFTLTLDDATNPTSATRAT